MRFKLGLVAAAMLLGSTALTTPAFATGNNNGGNGATQDHTCQGGHNCNTTTVYDIDINKGGTGYGGHGYGGHGYGGKGGDGGDANNNGNHNGNLNGNLNGNHNGNNNGNNNGNLKNVGNARQDQDQHQGQLQGQAQKVENVGNVHIENERPPVNTAYSAALATSEDTCMGSSSIGGQAVSFGLTIGTTWTDDNCQRLKNSRQLVALGYHRAATSLMCFNDDVREAMNQAGTPCPSGAAVYVAPPPPPPAPAYVPMAPIVDDKPIKRKKRVRKALPPK
jgi:hypothetical protein